ncbi:hypothetical protein [Mycobacterium sp.]|jgi:hypothetical protein|uniref:hypothetical protein n=1 Tax=Mycobacterium sp. TaxID=1785 RepID=UPI003C768D1C
MRIRFRYVTVEVDDRLRQRLALAVDRLRINVTAYLHIASDDVGVASQRLRGMCDRAAERVDVTLATVNDRIDPADAPADRRLTAV